MSTISQSLSISRPFASSRLSLLQHQFAEWRSCMRSRHELMNLSDRTLRDIGVSRCDPGFAVCKPFWMP